MGSGNNVRAGGAYVEAFVDRSKLDSQLADVNKKIRSSVSLAKSSIGSVGHGAAHHGGLAVGAIALASRAVSGMGAAPAGGNQVALQLKGLTASIESLKPLISQIKSPVKELFDRFTGGITESSFNLRTMRTLLGNLLPPDLASKFDESMRRVGDSGKKGSYSIVNAFTDSLGGKLATRAGLVARIFGDKLQLELAQKAKRATDAMRIDFASKRSFSEGLTTWAVIGVRRGFLGAAGATLSAVDRFTGRIVGRMLSGLQGLARFVAGKKISTGLDEIGGAANGASTKLEKTASVASQLGGKLSALGGIGNRAAGSLAKIGAVSGGIVATLAGAAAFNTGSLSAAFTSFKDFNPATAKKMADTLGLSVEQVTRLGSAAELSGSSLDSVRGAIGHVTELAKDGSDKFVKYGLSLEGMQNASPERRLELVAIALKKITDPAKRSAAAMELLGTSDLGPMLEDLDGFRNKAEALGGVLSTKDVAASLAFKNSIGEMHLASKALGQTLSSAIVPQLIEMVQGTTRTVSAVRDWAAQNPELIGQIFNMAKKLALLATVTSTFWAVGSRLAFLGPIITAALPFAPIILVTGAIAALLLTFTPMGQLAREAFTALKEAAGGAVGFVTDGIAVLKADFDDVWSGMVDALAAGDLSLAAEIAIDGVKLAFARGWATIHSGYLDFKNDFLSGWDVMTAKVKVAGDDMFPGFESAWSETVSFLEDAWTIFVNGIISGWDQAFGFLTKSINYLRSLFSSAFDLESADKAVDAKILARRAERGDAQDKLIGAREAKRDQHKEDVKTKGLASALEDENAAAREARRKEAEEARAADLEAINAAKEKLALARQKAAAERRGREEAIKTVAATGAESAKAGASQASRKGFEASDVRSKEGLSAIAGTARGSSPLDKSLDVQQKTLAEAKKQTDLQWKQWKQMQEGLVPAWPSN